MRSAASFEFEAYIGAHVSGQLLAAGALAVDRLLKVFSMALMFSWDVCRGPPWHQVLQPHVKRTTLLLNRLPEVLLTLG